MTHRVEVRKASVQPSGTHKEQPGVYMRIVGSTIIASCRNIMLAKPRPATPVSRGE